MTVDRAHVLRTAAALLARKSSTTMDEVARAAGIGRTTLHRYFPGRDVLVRALEDYGIASCKEALSAARLDEGTAVEALRRLISQLEPSSGLLAFLYTENQLFEGEEQNQDWERIDAQLTGLFRRGQESGEFRIDLSPTWLTEALYGLMAVAAWAVSEGRAARNDFEYMIVELLLGGAVRREET